MYLGSADWINRNLHERVEVLFPLKNPLLRDRVVHKILAATWLTTSKCDFCRAMDDICVRGSRRAAVPNGRREVPLLSAPRIFSLLSRGQRKTRKTFRYPATAALPGL